MATNDHPIIFSAPMVRAILAGRKTMTRRVVKPQPEEGTDCQYHVGVGEARTARVCPYGRPGDRLWVREGIRLSGSDTSGAPLTEPPVHYLADGPCDKTRYPFVATAIYMPRWACRITMDVTEVRVERLQDISEEDARAEGLKNYPNETGDHWGVGRPDCWENRASLAFKRLWDSLSAKRGHGWDTNPWVWVIAFKVAEKKEAAA